MMSKTIWNWCKQSETLVVARLLTTAGALLTLAAQYSPMLLSPEVTHYIPSTWLGVYTAAIGVVVEVARRRNATDLKPAAK